MKVIFLILFFQTIHSAVSAQIFGCTDALATNFSSSATQNDGSCVYANLTISPTLSLDLPEQLVETSGLILFNNSLWSHNDNTNTQLYSFDFSTAELIDSVQFPSLINTDWEEISQDNDFIYIGDFGNNVNGNRSDLHIIRVMKNTLFSNSPAIDTLYFSYENQTDFSATGPNNTDFDCEAFIVGNDSIYLFTKQWISKKTTIYSLPKTPGNHVAQLKATQNVLGLITGATYFPARNVIALCAYNSFLQPFIYVLYDFTNTDFISGNKRKVFLDLPLHQVEGITTENGWEYFLSNESYVNLPTVNNPHKLHRIDLSEILNNYLTTSITENETEKSVLFPNPVNNYLFISNENPAFEYEILGLNGEIIKSGKGTNKGIDVSQLSNGIYVIRIEYKNYIFQK